jgi:glutamine amidotransferase
MSVAIIDYGSGNLRSAAKALELASHKSGLDFEVTVTNDPEIVRRADRIVLPGVGAFADCMKGLRDLPGMVDMLNERVLKVGRPFLGICVGMQLMATIGHEHGAHEGLNWIPGEVVPLRPADPTLKIPHMGWNELDYPEVCHHVLDRLPTRPHAYFVHSYHYVCKDPAHVLATADYGGPIAAVIGRDNLVGTQFHPEKSQETGLAVLISFLRWRP